MKDLPTAAEPARPVKKDLPSSPALSIIRNGPENFKGRKLGVLVSDGVDAPLLAALQEAAAAEGATIEIVAPTVGGLTASDGKAILARQKINGGPSVLYDAIAVIPSADGAALLAGEATAKDFVSDAFAHAKFIAYSDAAKPLLQRAGVTEMDSGCVPLKGPTDAKTFLKACRKLRFWEREAKVHAV